MADVIEFKKQYKRYYAPRPEVPQILTMPKMQYAMVSGQGGDPETSESFQFAIQSLYGVVYTIKFGRRKAQQKPDFSIAPLECLWWTTSGNWQFDSARKDKWRWTMMIWLPLFITPGDIEAAVDQLQRKKPNPMLGHVKLGMLDEGLVVQVLHLGPYAQEGVAIEKMHQYAQERGYVLHGKHHEVYLNDPRRVKSEKIATILRQPIEMLS